jgi:hypothetical protein
MRNDYNEALFYCGTAVELLLAEGKEDDQVYGCLGVAATHLGIEVSHCLQSGTTSSQLF